MGIRPVNRMTLYVAFAVSGFCALLYEILWTKYLSLTFGSTMPAVSIVAATFMGGLALGSYLLGRYADQHTNLLRLYAFLELAIAGFALLFPPTLEIVTRFHTWLERMAPDQTLWTYGIHLFFSALLLLPPTVCMGGTFPLMCRFFARKKSGKQIGRLYALNTLGATAGAFAAGYVMIPAIGLSRTGFIAIALNVAVAALSWRLSRVSGYTEAVDVSQSSRPVQHLKASEHRPWLIAIGLVGFFSLAYEILWTRVFLLFLGNTTYAFSLILCAFLIGLAVGGALYARMMRPEMNEKKIFIVLCALMGVSVLATAPFYDRLVFLFQFAHEASGERWWHLSMLSFCIVTFVMLLPTVLSGSLLPAAVAILDPGKTRTGEGVGLVVLSNTSGAVLGSLVAGFLLVPTLGLQLSFQLLAAANILVAGGLMIRSGAFFPTRWTRTVPALVVLCALAAVIPRPWNQKLMNSGVYVYAPKYAQQGGIETVLKNEKILKVIEGIDTTVAVQESADGQFRFFTVNGKTDGGTGRDMATQVLIGQLPMLMHSSPRDSLVIGLGTGISLRGLSDYPSLHIDCVEISPEVVKAASYFEQANDSALKNPRLDLTIGDGRNFLLTRSQKYDVIISEPSNPWQVGNANLFTHDFYQLASSKLKQRGIFAQWIGIYDITPENLKVALNTFLQSFPRVLAFKAGSDLILLGSEHKLAFNYLQLKRRMQQPEVAKTLSAVGVQSPGDLLAKHFLCSEKSLRSLSGTAELNTDDKPILEYSARYNIGEKTLGGMQMANMSAIMNVLDRVVLPLANLGRSGPGIARALKDIGEGFAENGQLDESRHFMQKAAEFEDPPRSHLSNDG